MSRNLFLRRTHRQLLAALFLTSIGASAAVGAPGRTMSEILAASKPSDWRAADPENTLYVELPSGRVVIELMPQFAPRHVANVRTLVRSRYFDGLAIYRVQDNFVVQWSDLEGTRPVGAAARTLPPEFTRPAAGLAFTALPDPDTYAPQTGFVDGFPAARDRIDGSAWLVHCYGTVGAGRENDVNSGGGTEISVVIGHAPRQLDRNVTPFGRVLSGMELLSSLPRATGAGGHYERTEQWVPIRQIKMAADVPAAQRLALEVLRTDTTTFAQLIESRRNRPEEWFKVSADRIDVCNVPLPVRVVGPR